MKYASYIQAICLSLIIIACVSFISRTAFKTLSQHPTRQLASADDAGGPVAYWNFDEGSGSTAADLSGSGNTGTLVNSPTWIAGKAQTGLSFDGTNDIVTAASDPIGSGAASISVWIYPRSLGQVTASIINNGKAVMSYGYNNRISFCSDGVTCPNNANFAVAFNQWSHVVVTRDASGLVNFYINGALSGTANQNSGTPAPASGQFRIGNTQNGAHTFDGIIDELRIYPRALQQSDIGDLYALGLAGTPSDPTAPLPNPTPGPTAVNGSCSTTVNMCLSGTLSDQTDTSSANLWQCVGSNGGTTASCSTAIVQAPVTVTPVNGVYTVNASGGTNVFTTIKGCADVVTAGQTCRVMAGTYDERITPKYSGTAGSPITFEASGNVKMKGFILSNKSNIKISGFEITLLGLTADTWPGIHMETSSNIQILNNTMHDGGRECVRMRGLSLGTESNNNVVRGNTMYRCGMLSGASPATAVDIFGHYNLIENNDISHNGEDFTRVTGGDYNVIRNNVWHDNSHEDWAGTNTTHIDGMQNWCTVSIPLPTRYLLIENNQMYNTPSSDTHFVIFQNYGLCDEHNLLVRLNTVKTLGDYILINDEKTKGVMLYHNTFSDSSIASTKPWNSVGWYDGSANGKNINNIYNNTTRDGGYVYNVSADAAPFEAHNNLAYNAGTTNLFANPIKSEIDVILGKDPLFVSPTNLALQSGSPAIDKGGYLTKVAAGDSGSGTTLLVEDANLFQDGWNGIGKDWIAVGSTANTVQIASINYAANTIYLSSSISRTPGAPVYLAKDSSGRQLLYGTAPDIGAIEYNNGSPSSPPPTVTYVAGDFNKDGYVNSLDFSAMSGAWNTSNTLYDLNKDGTVNTLDYSIMVQNWTR